MSPNSFALSILPVQSIQFTPRHLGSGTTRLAQPHRGHVLVASCRAHPHRLSSQSSSMSTAAKRKKFTSIRLCSLTRMNTVCRSYKDLNPCQGGWSDRKSPVVKKFTALHRPATDGSQPDREIVPRDVKSSVKVHAPRATEGPGQ